MEIRKLNTLRGLAALIVAVGHYSSENENWNWALGEGAGQIGVMLFFLLSGFLMSYLYFHKPPTFENVKAFAVARIARVAPLFMAVVIVSYGVRSLNLDFVGQFVYEVTEFNELLSHIFLLDGVSVLWTIPAELHFYALFALAWTLRSHIGVKVYVMVALLIFVDILWGFRYDAYSILGLTVTPTIIIALPYFVVGTVIGHLRRTWRFPERLQSHYFVLVLAMIPLLFPQTFQHITGREHGMWTDMGVLVAVSGIFFVYVFLIPDVNKITANSVGDFFGRISYSLYLLHIPLLLVFRYLGLIQGFFGLILYLAAASLVSQISYSVFEHPMRRSIRTRFTRIPTNQAA